MDEQQSKSLRILSLYERLCQGDTISKKEEAVRFGVNEKTIQRDIDELRTYIANNFEASMVLEYDRKKNGYVLRRNENIWLTNEEILVLAKVLLESRAFQKAEMDQLLDKLILQSQPENRRFIQEVIRNERFHYVPVQHNQSLINMIWDLSYAVRTKRVTIIDYQKEGNDSPVKRKLKPVGIVFSEYYFYLVAFLIDYDFSFPTIYRMDRIVDYCITDERFKVDYKNRFEEGEFRKRVQFMYAGELMKITFRFWGPSLQAILDRLPTAKIIAKDEQSVTIEAEVYGRGIKMWLLSQAQYLEVLKPEEFRNEMRETIEKMLKNYK
ncbi:WYL domain-containing protein [Aeribacillus sp. FSL K6-1121]|jgi:predicted DNA-binding transcriptional regulator YafY|uniref:helix-turn-helix transcriptional regulator n=1 Tax=unclassified Aeribacillus TaxID=2640495 RepID=UPI002870E9C4|nr:WYL domain-containing protein [Aeribacillus pallidus]